MSIRARVENDIIKLPEGVHLPDGAEVDVIPVPAKPDEATETFADGFRQFFGMIKDGPGDMARNHDHYLYGLPRRSK